MSFFGRGDRTCGLLRQAPRIPVYVATGLWHARKNLGYAEINYKVNRVGDINEVQLYLDYQLFNNIQFGYYTLKEKQAARNQVKQFEHEIYKEVTKLYPDEKWQGCYVASFTNIFNQDVTLEFFNRSNFNDNNILEEVQWLPYRDAGWEYGIWEELEK